MAQAATRWPMAGALTAGEHARAGSARKRPSGPDPGGVGADGRLLRLLKTGELIGRAARD